VGDPVVLKELGVVVGYGEHNLGWPFENNAAAKNGGHEFWCWDARAPCAFDEEIHEGFDLCHCVALPGEESHEGFVAQQFESARRVQVERGVAIRDGNERRVLMESKVDSR